MPCWSAPGAAALAIQDVAHREGALATFLVTPSGLTLAGSVSAFRGVAACALGLFAHQWRRGALHH